MTKQEEIREGIITNITKVCPNMLNRDIVSLADKILQGEYSQGVVIKVDRELPQHLMEGQEAYSSEDIKHRFAKAGYVVVESLINEGNMKQKIIRYSTNGIGDLLGTKGGEIKARQHENETEGNNEKTG